jgi:hypothetical protein
MLRAYPESSALWRREWEIRKTGDFSGDCFPHYHAIFFNLPFVHHEEINRIWSEVIGHTEYVRTEIKSVHNVSQAIYYVAKYMSKPEDLAAATAVAGRTPAGGGDPDAGEAGGSLVYSAYMTEGGQAPVERQRPISKGRTWGLFNRSKIPWSPMVVKVYKYGPWFHEAKKYSRRIWQSIDPMAMTGYTLFIEEADNWLSHISDIHDAHGAPVNAEPSEVRQDA